MGTVKKYSDRDVSLARALSKLGYTSRSQAEQVIRERRVTVNGTVIDNPSYRCALASDQIAVDGTAIQKKELIYLVMHKPVGVVTTRSDERHRSTVYDLLGDVGQWVFPVGRLDKETSGLLLFTNDHKLGERLTNPRSKVPKTYLVDLDRPIADHDAALIRKGMPLDGERLMPAAVTKRKGNVIELTIHEGKNRQIRRMCEHLGYRIVSLVRTRIGGYELGNLQLGGIRHLDQSDVDLFMTA